MLVAASPVEGILIAENLRRDGHAVIVAVSEGDARHFVAKWKPALVVCQAQDGIGLSVLNLLREQVDSTPLLFASDFENEQKLLEAVRECLTRAACY